MTHASVGSKLFGLLTRSDEHLPIEKVSIRATVISDFFCKVFVEQHYVNKVRVDLVFPVVLRYFFTARTTFSHDFRAKINKFEKREVCSACVGVSPSAIICVLDC